MYVIGSLAQKRAFESFRPHAGLDQIMAGPEPFFHGNNKIVPEDYSDFTMKIKTFKDPNNHGELQVIVNSFQPDIYVQSFLPCRPIKLPDHCKKVYVSHGLIGSHVKGMIKQAGFRTEDWRDFDLYCGAGATFDEWIKKVAKVGDDKILLNALPQFDLLYDKNYYESYRSHVLSMTKNPTAKKVVLFVGFEGKDRIDFDDHNEDYFKTVLELERIARKNNWLIMIKPRHYYDHMIRFLKAHEWGRKYSRDYSGIQNSKYLHFIITTGHIYRYFFADVVALNACSTVEVEACAIQKPLLIVRTKSKDSYDPYGTINAGAGIRIKDIKNLENCIVDTSHHNTEKQNMLVENFGITFDGQMAKRIQDKIVSL